MNILLPREKRSRSRRRLGERAPPLAHAHSRPRLSAPPRAPPRPGFGPPRPCPSASARANPQAREGQRRSRGRTSQSPSCPRLHPFRCLRGFGSLAGCGKLAAGAEREQEDSADQPCLSWSHSHGCFPDVAPTLTLCPLEITASWSPLLPDSTQDCQRPLLHQDTPQAVPATGGAIHSQFILSGIQSRAAPFTPKNTTQALEYTKIFAYFLHLTIFVFQ